MDDRDLDMEEKRLLDATLRVVQITANLVVQNPDDVQDFNTSSPESGSDIFNYDSPKFHDFEESEERSYMNSSEPMMPDDEARSNVTSNDYQKQPPPPPPPQITPAPLPKEPLQELGKFYKINFYFSDGEVRATRFQENATFNDILMYLRSGKYYHEDWTSIYCDVRCREPKMNLGKMKLHQTLSQTKLPDEFSVDVKIKNLFE